MGCNIIYYNKLNIFKMIKQPQLNVMNTKANPLVIVGVLVIMCPIIMTSFGTGGPILNMILYAAGGLLIAFGLVMYFADNL